jgi:hypothetical protein
LHDGGRVAGGNTPEIAQLEFCSPASSFDALMAAAIEIAAVQRGWRDFRIAE